ncbi:hypothetical protein B1F79_00555 [Coxiella-like endosymbiont of Rhipicephalus sanguineus]|nr:hypothetical protein [Coxiella-like endosymbiont of Rhipicephalus sanguineus]
MSGLHVGFIVAVIYFLTRIYLAALSFSFFVITFSCCQGRGWCSCSGSYFIPIIS